MLFIPCYTICMDRPFTTLFMIQSLDGKISPGDVDELDVDKDFPRISGVKEGLHQYYELEKQTDPFSLNSGRVMAKIGVNTRTQEPQKIGCSFVIIDNQPHLTAAGTIYLAKWVKTLFLVTTNKSHPAFQLRDQYPNIEIIEFSDQINFYELLTRLKTDFGIERLTIQSGGELNSQWLRQGLIDEVSLVIAPCLIGGKNTQSLIGGESLHTFESLKNIKSLELKKCDVLDDNYLHVVYQLNSDTALVKD